MANCLDDKIWGSKVPKTGGKEKAQFKITSQSGNGDFEGEFKVKGMKKDQIKGNCSGNTIWFHRLASRTVYRYSGTFTLDASGGKIHIDGQREVVAAIRTDPDEWVADKTVTRSSRKRAAGKKSASKKAVSKKASTKKRS